MLSTVDMVVQQRDGPRRLRENDDDDDDEMMMHTVRSRIYVTVECPSVCLSRRTTAVAAGGCFAAKRRRGQ